MGCIQRTSTTLRCYRSTQSQHQMLGPLTSVPRTVPWRYISVLLTLLLIVQYLLPRSNNTTTTSVSRWERLTSPFRSSRCLDPTDQRPLPTSPAPAAVAEVKEEYLALCLFIKNEPTYLPEWLAHHYTHMNVSRFYIMDDASSPPLSSVESYGDVVPREKLTFHYYHDDRKLKKRLPQQPAMYSDCLSLYGAQHTWMGFIDVDEYVGIRTTESLHGILQEMEAHADIGALAINWRIHTSAGLLTRPESARHAFNVCVDDGSEDRFANSVKSIVRTAHVVGIDPEGGGSGGIHTFALRNGTHTVGEDWIPLNETTEGVAQSWRVPGTRQRVGLHHYLTRSRGEFQEKMRSAAQGDNPRTEAFWQEWEGEGNGRKKVDCGEEMGRYVP